MHFSPNLRSVLPESVNHVQAQYLRDLTVSFSAEVAVVSAPAPVLAAVEEVPEQRLTYVEELRAKRRSLRALHRISGVIDRPRLCVFGDSHYACLKQAEVQGLVDVSGVDLEYWGHVGGRFRYLEFRDGSVQPLDDFTARRFAKFNAKGREHLPAAVFDVIHVTGARVYVWGMFNQLLQGMAEGPFISSGLVRRILVDGLRGQAGYRLAAGLASTRTAQVLLSPVAYYTADPERFAQVLTPSVRELIPDQVPRFWEILQVAAVEDGVELLRQPEETVTAGLFTDEAFAVADHVEKRDFEHHNAAYGALILGRAVAFARRGRDEDRL